jgi:hypothetical protein
MANDGKQYELFVANLQQALLDTENVTTQKNIRVETNKKILDNCEIERQFDIYWEYELGGLTYKTVIECKDYNSYVSVEKIDAIIGKVKDLPDLKAVFATKMGYQSGARTKAEQNKIDLLVVREQNDSDWKDADGTPLVKKICMNIHVYMPAHIHKFEPKLDAKWIKENGGIDTSQPLSIAVDNNEIFVDDIAGGEKYSLYQLASKLSPLEGKEFGQFEKVVSFDDAFICSKDVRLKISSYKVEYSISEPHTVTKEIDFSKELVGVIEYLQKGTKKSIFKNGIVR